MSKIKVYRNPVTTKNYLITVAIGDSYLDAFESFALKSWQLYAEKNDLGILALVDFAVPKNHVAWKKATWHKLLVSQVAVRRGIEVENVCYLDTDILINPFAPNIFNEVSGSKIGVVSNTHALPYNKYKTQKRISFNRKKYFDSSYPLDSFLFSTTEQFYAAHDSEDLGDLFCAGLFVYNYQVSGEFIESVFFDTPGNVHTATAGGDNPIVAREFIRSGRCEWLDYRYQALWMYDMASKYSFLYRNNKKELVIDCVFESLSQNYFLHFNGSLWEGEMWKLIRGADYECWYERESEYKRYEAESVTGESRGRFKTSIVVNWS